MDLQKIIAEKLLILKGVMPDKIFQMIDRFFKPEMQNCIKHIESIAGYRLDDEERKPFLYFHNFITNPQPDFITKWRSDTKTEKRYHQFVNRFLVDVQNAYTCVKYHFDNLNTIENCVLGGLSDVDIESLIENSTLAIGNTLKWDFEYQAFILAYRRCLDYLAKAIASYFKNDFHSFRKLEDFLFKQRTGMQSLDMLMASCKNYGTLFKFVLSEGDRKSTRDKINHYAYVSVGTLNIQRKGSALVGGEEKLDPSRKVVLSDILRKYKENFDECISEIISLFVEFIIEDQEIILS